MAERVSCDKRQLAHMIEKLTQRVEFLESKLACFCHIDCPKDIRCSACGDYGCNTCGKHVQLGMGIKNYAYFHNTCAMKESGSLVKNFDSE